MTYSKSYIFKYFYHFIVPFKKIVLINLFTVFSICILGMISPLIFRVMFDDVFPAKNLKLFFILIVIGFSIETILAVLNFVKEYVNLYILQKVQHNLRHQIFRKFEDLSISYYSSISIGDHLWRLTNDVTKIQEMVATNIPRVTQTFLELFLLLILSFWIDWKLCVVALTIIPVFVVNGIVAFEKFRFFDKSSQEREAEVNGFLKENISGIEEVKINNSQVKELVKYLRKISNKIRVESKGKTFYLGFNLFNQQFTKIWAWLITAIAGYHVIEGEITIGDYIAVTTYLLRIFGPLNAFTNIYQEVIWQLVSGERLLHFLELPEEETMSKVRRNNDQDFTGDIVFQDVSFKYKDYLTEVIKNFDLRIPKGQKVALIGPIGCGKTTLIKLLLKFYKPLNGNLFINSTNVIQVPSKVLRKKIGVVMQRPIIFNETILSNIKYGNKNVTDAEVISLLKQMDVYDYFLEFESGLNRLAGEDGCNLSGGQKQLIAIARAYIKYPEILIFDEATSSLDTFMELKINLAMKKLMAGKTVIMIAHRLSSINDVERIIFMRDGKIVEDGSPENLLALKGYYYKIHSQYYGLVEKNTAAEFNDENEVIGDGFYKIWDLSNSNNARYFQGNVRFTKLYDQAGELEVNLTGYSGYCAKVCVGEIPKRFLEKELKKISFDIYIPEKTMKNVENYLMLHLISSNYISDWHEIDSKKLNTGWNYIVLSGREQSGKYLNAINKLFFAFNSDNIINGPIYITNIKGQFSDE